MPHYHIITKSETFHYPQIITAYIDRCQTEYIDLVLFARDYFAAWVDGQYFPAPQHHGAELCSIVDWTKDKVIFRDHTEISIHVCTKDCIERLSKASAKWYDSDEWPQELRDFIYEG